MGDRTKLFPMLDGPPITWQMAEAIYADYTTLFSGQSLERIAERGGFGYSEIKHMRELIMYERKDPRGQKRD